MENYYRFCKKCNVILCIFLLGITCCVSYAHAEDFFVNGSVVDDSGDGTTLASAKKYISSGIALMSQDDTLFIAEGTYTGENNIIQNVPSGSGGSFGGGGGGGGQSWVYHYQSNR